MVHFATLIFDLNWPWNGNASTRATWNQYTKFLTVNDVCTMCWTSSKLLARFDSHGQQMQAVLATVQCSHAPSDQFLDAGLVCRTSETPTTLTRQFPALLQAHVYHPPLRPIHTTRVHGHVHRPWTRVVCICLYVGNTLSIFLQQSNSRWKRIKRNSTRVRTFRSAGNSRCEIICLIADCCYWRQRFNDWYSCLWFIVVHWFI